jgi:hypothetical protein
MGSALTPALAVSSSMIVRRRRELPIRGDLLIQEGGSVRADSVVAVAQLEGELRLVRTAELLGIPAAEIRDVVKVREGQAIAEGELLAEVRGLWGLFRSAITAPLSGVVEFISSTTGHIGVRAPARPLNLNAYIPGTVVGTEPGRSVLIESRATFVQGIFGVGGERQGRLKILEMSGTAPLTADRIPEDVAGAVLVGGCSPTSEALHKASARGAVGLITGSIDDETLREYVGHDIGVALTGDEDVSMTVIVTEGFGLIPLSQRILDTLRRIEGAQVSINGATQVRAGAQRPELIGPESAVPDAVASRNSSLEVGARIRIIRVPFFGLSGRVTEMPPALERIETGAEVRVLRASLDDGRVVTVPRANVELE